MQRTYAVPRRGDAIDMMRGWGLINALCRFVELAEGQAR
jgi:hypothetical protein